MSQVRVTISGSAGGRFRSRIPGTQVGLQVNTFGMDRLIAGVNGDSLLEITMEAGQIAFDQAFEEWPVLTGASRDSIELIPAEVEARRARVILQVGGPLLIDDPRNRSHKDYAPFLEFNGSPSGSSAPGVILRAIADNDAAIREAIHAGVAALIQGLVA